MEAASTLCNAFCIKLPSNQYHYLYIGSFLDAFSFSIGKFWLFSNSSHFQLFFELDKFRPVRNNYSTPNALYPF